MPTAPTCDPTVLAIALLALYGLFFVVPPVRDFFELAPLALVGRRVHRRSWRVVWALLVMVAVARSAGRASPRPWSSA